MKRVLHVLHSYPPESRGGIETYVERLARHQRDSGLEPLVLAPTYHPDIVGDQTLEGVRVLRVQASHPLGDAISDEEERIGHWAKELAQLEPDIVHVHHWHGIGPFLSRAARAVNARTVVTLHDLFATCALFFRLREDRELCSPNLPSETCAACVAKSAGLFVDDLITAIPERTKRYRAELDAAHALATLSRAQADYLTRVPELAGLDLSFSNFPTLDGIAPLERKPARKGPLQVATWGGLVRGKGLHLLAEAASQLPSGSLELHHHGPVLDESYANEVRSLAGDVPLTLHGRFEPDELRGRLREVDLAVHPSLFLETYGFTTDEALHFGLPVLVPDRGAPAERIGNRGATFRVNDAEDLASQLRELVENPSRLESLRNGLASPLVSWDEHVEALQGLYG